MPGVEGVVSREESWVRCSSVRASSFFILFLELAPHQRTGQL